MKAQNGMGCKLIARLFPFVHDFSKACAKSFQQFDLLEDEVVEKFLVRPGSTNYRHVIFLCYTHDFTAGMLCESKKISDRINFSSAASVLQVCTETSFGCKRKPWP